MWNRTRPGFRHVEHHEFFKLLDINLGVQPSRSESFPAAPGDIDGQEGVDIELVSKISDPEGNAATNPPQDGRSTIIGFHIGIVTGLLGIPPAT